MTEKITTKIWDEVPEEDNPFAAKTCYCAGYDVYGDLLGKASWSEYIYLLFKLEKPTRQQAALLEGLAVVLANPGLRDHSVRAAMNAGVGGSTHASALMAAIAVGAGNLGGGRDVYWAVQYFQKCDRQIDQWPSTVEYFSSQEVEVWPEREHIPGFDPNGSSCPLPIKQSLSYLISTYPEPESHLQWLFNNRAALEETAGYPLAMSGLAAAVFLDLDLKPEQAEMLYMILRLPGAAAHALEQEKNGWRKYPFFGSGLVLTDDPNSASR
ncbi:citryl-CoA lyase [Porticoccus sp. W117]|uniref:citryl-CoA lyase n=1 Tax=Porticoccus sp. W117 TaxID=3054777 RepID=UPI00259545D4|nr:citryl-CoA lyase [Porticoccus sp. W117]